MKVGDRLQIGKTAGRVKKGTIVILEEVSPDGMYKIKVDGTVLNISPSLVKPVESKVSRVQRREQWVAQIKEIPESYEMAGWIIYQVGRIRVSSPHHLIQKTSEYLQDLGIDNEIGKTVTGKELAQGPSVTVIVKNPGTDFIDRFQKKTGVTCSPY